MAEAAPRRCSCGKIVPYGMKCECQIARDRARKAANDRNRPSARDRGYSSKWDRARAGFLAKHPLCRCGAKATIVDHIRPHRGDVNLFWDRKNWQPLCVRCHSSAKQSEEHRSGSNALAHPFIDKPPTCPVTIVAGAPGSGKSTYVAERAGPDDIVIDVPTIMAKLAKAPLYQAPASYARDALEIRNKALRMLGEPNGYRRAWFVTADPDPAARATWCRKLKASVVTMPATLEECIANIEADPRRAHCKAKHIELAKDWFAKNRQDLKATASAFMKWRAQNTTTSNSDDDRLFAHGFDYDAEDESIVYERAIDDALIRADKDNDGLEFWTAHEPREPKVKPVPAPTKKEPKAPKPAKAPKPPKPPKAPKPPKPPKPPKQPKPPKEPKPRKPRPETLGKTYTFNGLTMTLTQWAQHLGVKRSALQTRVRRGYPIERVLTTEQFKTQRNRSKDCNND
ncbi:MAG: HNH endonuclease [Rhizobiales bacterium]|nr:HNH endonuclease [Hyphomicrobiales bacterium]